MSSDWLQSAFNFTAAPPTEAAYAEMLRSDENAQRQAQDDARLMQAMRQGRLDTSTLQDLMWTKANFNLMHDGMPLLHHLVARRDLPALLLVISGARDKVPFVSPGDTDEHGLTALDHAEMHGWAEGAKYLRLYHHDISGDDTACRPRNHQTRMNGVLALAVQKSDADVARRALLLGADPNTQARANLSVLHLACLWLETGIVDLLLEAGADLHAPHARGHNALQLLWWCTYDLRLSKKWYEMVDHLRARGARDDGFKLLEEMSIAELHQPPAGSGIESPAMDIALQGNRMDIYLKALAAKGKDKPEALLKPSRILQETPLMVLARRNQLHQVFTADLWKGAPDAMLRAWQGIAAEVETPLVSVATQRPVPRSFTAKDFARLLISVRNDAARRKFKLPKGGRP